MMKQNSIILSLFLLPFLVLASRDNPISVEKKAQLDTISAFSRRIRVLNALAYNYGLSHMDSALKYANVALNEARAEGDRKEEAKAIGMLGILHEKIGDYEKAMELQEESFHILEELNDVEGMAGTMMQFGNINLFYGRYEKAQAFYFQSLEKFEESGNQARIAGCLNNIGVVYQEMQEFEKAEEYLQRALKVNQELGNRVQEGRCYNNLGLIQTHYGHFEQALDLFAKCEEIYREQANKRGMASLLTNKSEALSKMGRHQEALTLLDEGLQYALETENINGQMDNYLVAAEVFQNLGQNGKALSYLQKGMSLARQSNAVPFKIKFHQGLAENWAQAHRYDSAYFNHQAYTVLKDSIFDLEKETRINELEGLYATAKKEQKIADLSHKNEIQALQLSRNRNYLYIAGGVVIIVVMSLGMILLYFSRFRMKTGQKTSELEQKLLRSQMNPHFIYNSLNSIQHFIYTHQSEEAGIYLAKFAELIRMILESSRDEAVSLEKEIRLLRVYLDLQKLRFEDLFNYEIEIDQDLQLENVQIPPMLAQPFIENSIEHAFRGMTEGGMISIRFSRQEHQVLMEIEDNGIGIDESRRLKQDQSQKHRSLALDITKERLDFLKRTRKLNVQLNIIDKKSQNPAQSGTRVTFSLPDLSWQ